MSKGGGKFIIGTLVGAVAGAVAGLLLAPKSGKQTRKMIGDKTKDYAQKGKDIVVKEEKEIKEAISNVAEKISK